MPHSSATDRATGTVARPAGANDLSGASLLLVEDDIDNEALVTAALARAGLAPRLLTAATLAAARDALASGDVDIVVLDLGLPDSGGLDTLDAVVATAPDVPVIVLTGAGDSERTGVAALQLGAQDYLVKGATSPIELSRAIRFGLARRRAQTVHPEHEHHRTALEQVRIAATQPSDLRSFIETVAAVVASTITSSRATVRLAGGALRPPIAVTSAVQPATGSRRPATGTGTELATTTHGQDDLECTLELALHAGSVLTPGELRLLDTVAALVTGRAGRDATASARTRQLTASHELAHRLQAGGDAAAVVHDAAQIVLRGLGHGDDASVTVSINGLEATAGHRRLATSSASLEQPIRIAGETVGRLRLLRDHSKPWREDESTLAHGAADQLATWWALTIANVEHDRDLDRVGQLMSIAPVGLALVDAHGRVSFANDRARDLLDLAPDAEFPWHFGDGRAAAADKRLGAIAAVRHTGTGVADVHYTHMTASGTVRVLSIDASPLSEPSKDTHGLALALTDVTAEERRAQLLESALERERRSAEGLRRVADLKDGFLRAVSHELRTPLASIVGFAETLRDHGEDFDAAGRTRMVDRVVANGQRLTLLLEDLLDVGRLTAGSLSDPNRTEADVAELVHAIVPLVPLNGRTLVLDLDAAPAFVEGRMVERVVHNLLTNAVRHTPAESTVWIHTARADDAALLVVEDDGPGIAEDDRDRVFEPFVQGSHAAAAPNPGTGVGLSLVRQFARLHGGSVRIGDRDGGGARFEVRLPDHPRLAD